MAEVEGTGIGLSLTKRIIESMEGSIGVDSEPGRGSSFWIDIPLSLESRVSIEAPRTSTGIFGVIEDFNKKILYIEDDEASRNLINGVIQQKVFLDLSMATTGQEGIDSALKQAPDLIILDIGLPDMSGFEVLKTLRSNSSTAHLPIIALSARASEKDIQEGISAGFDSYLTKPVLPKHLLKAISVAFYKG
jgi:CheY-like chemotaxis protein